MGITQLCCVTDLGHLCRGPEHNKLPYADFGMVEHHESHQNHIVGPNKTTWIHDLTLFYEINNIAQVSTNL